MPERKDRNGEVFVKARLSGQLRLFMGSEKLQIIGQGKIVGSRDSFM